jgi:hypothetical protein
MKLSVLRVLYYIFDEDREKVRKAVESLELDYLGLADFENGYYFVHNDMYYAEESYVINAYGDLMCKDEGFICNGYLEWYPLDNAVDVYEYRSCSSYSQDWVENHDELTYYNGDYYDSDALEYNDLVYVEDTEEIDRRDNVYHHDGDDGYYSYPDASFVRGYHDGSYRTYTFSSRPKYQIGYEIEKEDEDVRNSIDIDDFEDATDNVWRKEKDGSLDDDSGYELISPTFEFNIKKIFDHIEGNDELVKHINANHSKSCGGHIHLSERGLSGEQLFDKIKGYTPLFYALYYGRVDKNYCKGKKNDDLKYENEKYQAIKIHHDRVEFRIISAVPSVSTLKWRSKLLMMAIQNPTDDVIKAYYNVDTKFTKLLQQVYSTDKLQDLKHRFINYTQQFEGLDIK